MGYDLAMTTTLALFGVNWLVQSSVLLVLGLVAGRSARGRGPAIQSAVYRTTLAAVLVCPIASALLAASGFDGIALRLPTPDEPVVATSEPPYAVEPADEPARPEVVHAAPLAFEPPASIAPPVDDPEPAPSEVEPVVAPEPPPPPRRTTLAAAARWGVSAWLLGSLFLVVRLAIQQNRMRRLRASALPADSDVEALCAEIANRMNVARPTVWRSPFLFSPCLDGLRRPAILLPEDVDADLHDTFVHELAHLARRDGLWNLLRRLAAAALWFQPLLWMLSRRLEATAEEVCDDYVVHFGGDRVKYAGLLVELAGRALPPRSPAAVGMISLRSMLARRVVRILDTSRSLSTRAGRRAVLATLALGLASTAFAGLLGVGGQPPPPEAAEPTEAAPLEDALAPAADVPITGRIVDLEGRPVAGVVTTVEDVDIPRGDDLTAWIEGVKKGEPPWIAAEVIDWDRKTPEAKGRKATTDTDGRFRIDGLGTERVVRLSLQGEAIACDAIQVVLRKTSLFPAKGFANHNGAGFETIYGADFIYTAPPGRAVEGVVKDAKTGAPLAGAGVWSHRFAGSDFVGIHSLKTTTDARGRFRLNGFPRGKGNALLIVPNDDQPYFMREFKLPDPEGAGPIKVDVPAPRGIWIEGKITDRETGMPVPDAWLHYLPFFSNTFAQETPGFDKAGYVDGSTHQDRYLSKADGSFRLVGLPGKAIVGAIEYQDKRVKLYMQGAGSESIAGMNKNGHFETYSNPITPGRLWPTVMKEIDPPADAKSVRVDLQTTAGDSVRVRIASPDGRPVTPLKTIGRTEKGSYDRDDVDAAETEVQHLYPGEERTAAFRNKEKNLGKVVRVKKGDDAAGPVPINLEPLAKLTGAVVDEDGAAVSGARVRTDLLPSGDFAARLEETSTGANGRFVVPDVPTGCDYAMVVESPGPNRTRKIAILKKAVVKPGETTDVGELRFGNRDAQADQAAKPPAAKVPITGRIVDLEGRPVAGVVVTMDRVKMPKDGGLTAWLDGVKDRKPSSVMGRLLSSQSKSAEAKTDADGRFRMLGLEPERVAMLSLEGETIAYATIQVATRKMEPVEAPGYPNRHGPGSESIYGADFTYTAAPSRLIVGVVKDAKTGRPLAEMEVRSQRFAGSSVRQSSYPSLSTKTDAQGRFRLAGMPKGKDNKLLIVPNDEQPYFLHEVDVPDPPGSASVKVDVSLNEGVWIEGKLTERSTGKPIPEARMHYFPFRANPFAQAAPEFGANSAPQGVDFQDRYSTKADGSFRLVGLPGRGIVGAEMFGGPKKYMAGAGAERISELDQPGLAVTYYNPGPPGRAWPTVMKAIDPPADAKSVHVDLEAVEGDSVHLRLVAGDGRPVSDVQTKGLGNPGVDDRVTLNAEACDASNLQPGEERTVVFRMKARKLGKVVRVRKGDDAKGPIAVVLEPMATITGRVADVDGDPATAAMIRTLLLPAPRSFQGSLGTVVSGKDGRFLVPDVPIGCEYSLAIESDRTLKPRSVARVAKVVVKSGETTDVGEVRFVRKGERAPQAAKPATVDILITGRIVDLENRPVAGVVVKIETIKKSKDGDLTAWIDAVKGGETEWAANRRLVDDGKRGEAATDADGRFRIGGLGMDRVVEMSLAGTTIAYTTITAVTRPMAPLPAPGLLNHYGPGSTTIQGANFTYSAVPSHPVEGVVKDARTAKPLAGVEVRITNFAGSSFGGSKAPSTTTDAQGRFQLNGVPKRKGSILFIVPNDDQPYFIQAVAVPNSDGPAPIKIEAALHEGIWIEGRLTEQSTGKPIPEARVQYFPYRTNEFALAVPEFGKKSTYDGNLLRDRYTSKADGTFRLVGLPGKAVVGVEVVSGPNRYMAGAGAQSLSQPSTDRRKATYASSKAPGRDWPTVMKEIDPPADAKVARVDLEAVEGDSVRVRVVDPDGRPISGLEAVGREGVVFPTDQREPEPSQAECDVEHLQPGEARMVVFRHAARGLGKIVRFKKGDDAQGPVVVKLDPLATITGRIVDKSGAAVTGATTYVRPSEFAVSLRHVDTVSSGRDGRFIIPNLPTGGDYALTVFMATVISSTQAESLQKIAVQPGGTIDLGAIPIQGRLLEAAKAPGRDVPITGRIVDLEGRPIAGVDVLIRSVQVPNDGDLTAWIEAVRRGEDDAIAEKRLNRDRLDIDAIGSRTRTDADGRFRFEGVQADRVVELHATGEPIAFQEIHLVTRATAPFSARGFSMHYGPGPMNFHGPDFTYTATPSRPIEGVVKDAKTGRPIAGVEVKSDHFAGADMHGVRDVETKTDAEGRFRIAGMPKGKGTVIDVIPATGQPYFVQEVPIPDPAGLDPVKIEVALHEGIWIEGKVTDQSTGKPIAEARLYYLPFLTNPFAQATPEFSKGFPREGEFRFLTKADGSFRLLGLPGRAIVGASAPGDGAYMQGAGSEKIAGMNARGQFETCYNPGKPGRLWPTVMKEIDPPADAKVVVHVDLQATAGESVRVRVVDQDLRPLTGVKSEGRERRGSRDYEALNLPDAVVAHLGPDEERPVMFRHEGRKLGKLVRVRPGDDAKGPAVVKLEPLATITGRIVDEDGAAAAGATIQPSSLPLGDYKLGLPDVASDADGRFVLPDVPTGCDYWLTFHGSRPSKSSRFAKIEKVVVKAGETTDVGEVRFGAGGAQAAQAPKPPAADVPITGRIVDLEGRPIAGVVVTVRSVQGPNGDGLTAWIDAINRGEPEEMAARRLQNNRPGYEFVGVPIKTDADGRFRIEGLRSDRVVELLLTGESIAFQTIRLVTRATAPLTAKGFMNRYGPGPINFHGPDFTYTATPGRVIEGVVKDARTGRPIADVEVKSERFAGANILGVRDLEAKTDAEGRFRIAGLPKAKGNIIRAAPQGEQPYFAHLVEVPDPAGLDPVQVEIALHEGIWIEGELTDQRSGKPIPEARLYYFPLLSNPFAQAITGFARDFSSRDDLRFVTKADGTFRLLGLPGRAIVGALASRGDPYMLGAGSEKIAGMNPKGNFETFYGPGQPGKHWPTVMKEIDPPADAKIVRVDLQATAGASVRLRVVGTDGQSIPSVKSEGRTNRSGLDTGFLDAPDTVVSKLRPDEERMVLFRQLDRKLGKAARVRPGDDAEGPVVVKLEPLATVTGRIADADGVAVPGAMIQPSSLPLGDFTTRLSVVFSDAAGRFVVPNVPIGCDYQLVFHHRRTPKSDRMANLEKVVVKPGETTDVGEVRFKKD